MHKHSASVEASLSWGGADPCISVEPFSSDSSVAMRFSKYTHDISRQTHNMNILEVQKPPANILILHNSNTKISATDPTVAF